MYILMDILYILNIILANIYIYIYIYIMGGWTEKMIHLPAYRVYINNVYMYIICSRFGHYTNADSERLKRIYIYIYIYIYRSSATASAASTPLGARC